MTTEDIERQLYEDDEEAEVLVIAGDDTGPEVDALHEAFLNDLDLFE